MKSDTRIDNAWPPNINKIRAVFPLTGNEIFAYAGTIYNPSGNPLTAPLIAHEEVHFEQQMDDSGHFSPEGWWDRYLIDPAFRLQEELEAHREEYRTFCTLQKDRNRRSLYLLQISQRLASPMYGALITVPEAVQRIRG